MTTLHLIVLLFVGLVYATEDLTCASLKCIEGAIQCAYCDGEFRFFRSECAVETYNCNNPKTPCEIVELEYCFEKACPVKCKRICATDGDIYMSFASECEYFEYICKTRQKWKEVDIRNCIEPHILN